MISNTSCRGPRRAAGLRLLAGLLAGVLVALGCTPSAPESDGPAADGGVALVELLASAGIATYAEPGVAEPVITPAAPVSPVALLQHQVAALEPQSEGGVGFTGGELDELVAPAKAGKLTARASKAIDGWAEHAGTPAADLAQRLLARPDGLPESVPAADVPRYSELVLLLFASDVATAAESLPRANGGGSGPGSTSAAPVALRSALAAGDIGAACQKAVAFVGNVRAAVHNALNKLIINPPSVNTGFGLFDAIANAVVQGIVGLANTTIRGAQILVDNVVQATVGQVFTFVGEVAAVVGTLAQITSYVKPWDLTVGHRDPEVNQMGVAPAQRGPRGTVTARVHVLLDKWPTDLAQCAAAAGRPLPKLKPEGNDVTWKLENNGYHAPSGLVLATRDGTRTEAQLTSNGTAQFGYHAGVEPPPEDDAPVETGVVWAHATIKRDDLTELRKMFDNLVVDAIKGALPLDAVPFARTLVDKAARGLLTQVTGRVVTALEKLRTQTKHGMIAVTYHGQDGKKPAKKPGPEGTPDSKQGSIPRGCPKAGVIGHGAAAGYSLTGQEAGLAVVDGRACAYHSTPLGSNKYWVVVTLVAARTVETTVPGELAFVVDGTQRRAPVQLGWERLDLAGADTAWISTRCGNADRYCHQVVAVVADRTIQVGAEGTLDQRDVVVGIAQRILTSGR